MPTEEPQLQAELRKTLLQYSKTERAAPREWLFQTKSVREGTPYSGGCTRRTLILKYLCSYRIQ